MASLRTAHSLHGDLQRLELELSKDWNHAKHFVGDFFGHLEHVRAPSAAAHARALRCGRRGLYRPCPFAACAASPAPLLRGVARRSRAATARARR